VSPGRYAYEGFGLAVASTRPLPKLRRTRDPPAEPDVLVETGSLPRAPADVTEASAVIHEDGERGFVALRTPDALYWFYEGVGSLRIRAGREIVVDPTPTASRTAVERLLLGPGMQSVLVQRGRLVGHAGAVVIDDSLVAVAGPSGRGKLTVAAACHAAGHAVHADDTVAVDVDDGEPSVPPGIQTVRVTRATADSLSLAGGETGGKIEIEEDRGTTEAKRVERVYVLTEGDGFGVDPLANGAAVFELLRASCSLYDDANADAAASHLAACGALAEGTSVRRLRRPRSLDRLPGLVELLKADASD
jgi:hypothetical protein